MRRVAGILDGVTHHAVPPQPVSSQAPTLRGIQIMKQSWQDLAFLHWRIDPERLTTLMPAGVRPDEYDGSSWIGLIPFEMVGAGPFNGPAIPWLGTFAETNVRLYTVDEQGRRGVLFLSLETQRLAVMIGARAAFGTKYMWSKMQITRRDGQIEYDNTRRWPGPKGTESRVVIRPGAHIQDPDPLALFLTSRWGLHTSWLGRTLYVPNEHPPWPLHQATVVELDDHLLAAAGFADLGNRAPDSVLYSPGVYTIFGMPQR